MTVKRIFGSGPNQIARNKDLGKLAWQTIPTVGQMTYTGANTLGAFSSNVNGYNQVILQNTNAGASASSDLIVSNDAATDSTNYGDFGINSSAFSGSGPFSVAGGVYLYSASGPLALGTAASSYVTIGTNNAEVARFDASGNLGIGTTNPTAARLQVAGYNGGTTYPIRMTSFYSGVEWAFETGGSTSSGSFLAFRDLGNSAERMRIDSSGNLLVGTTSDQPPGVGNTVVGVRISGSNYVASSRSANPCGFFNRTTSDGELLRFSREGTQVGSVSVTTTATTYNTSSDYRLKENIQPMQNALGVVAQLNPVTYTWKADGSDGQGFIAHELQAVVPDCVTGEKDAVDKDGKPIYQGIDTSFLVATLTKAIQELKAELDELKAKVN